MKFGDENFFAVEFDLDDDYGGVWLYGKFCYWISGSQVGNYELGTSLRDVLFQMKWVVHDCGNRDGGILCELPPLQAFSMIDGTLYENDDDDAGSEIQMPETPARFDICIPVDIFSEWKIYLIECDSKAHILFRNNDDKDIRVVIIPAGVFDDVIKEASDCLDKLYEKERASE